ncbi:MAG TPA: bifunctional diaminohydroxyphosphoribosylaminopyrimidine deaminase/5-amino-6-(5-phosphoribosylamino)uracil reductase RibD, partial [Clostridiales bacterium]|nr:bifunctional diaminohydroxyphosphoribosylaminopyrimidine deaminase/5-amino-6-(5-phosphoribosylamino)uracil reductase RibD [Clostridiales bacterium]
HGIEVVTGVLEEEARKLNEIFIKYITTKTPFCLLKTAMTLDGKIAAHTGDSKWITGEASRKAVHELRHRFSAIMVGIQTVLADNPLLTTRLENKKGRNPVRIIVDSRGRIPLEANVLQCDAETATIIATTKQIDGKKKEAIEKKGARVLILPSKEGKVSLKDLMRELGRLQIDSVLLEGGSTLNASALQEGIVDKVAAFIAPKILGGENAKTPVGGRGKDFVREAFRLENIRVETIGEDILIEGDVRKEESTCLQDL